ncbi:hypothetical protein JAAARDRAFT_45002 [Jaapia argillacea MUCL 33604]|uniref:Uncharacterized protein n=1 Tax=Jaapia argillacea MUCL 33604 TaxID=933084 RepID=A0A067Q6W0_9AGAM|nr:hypothetical protein JAAARDRAFT_45002 [Jaapia argillacea MUCL 33604]
MINNIPRSDRNTCCRNGFTEQACSSCSGYGDPQFGGDGGDISGRGRLKDTAALDWPCTTDGWERVDDDLGGSKDGEREDEVVNSISIMLAVKRGDLSPTAPDHDMPYRICARSVTVATQVVDVGESSKATGWKYIDKWFPSHTLGRHLRIFHATFRVIARRQRQVRWFQ